MDLLALLHGKHVLEVEDGLLPVGVLCVRAGREGDSLVAGGELDVEPGNERVDEIVAAGGEIVGDAVGEIGDGAGVEVESENGGGIGDDGLHLDGVDQGLGQGGLLEGSVVETIDVVPDWRNC